MAIRGLTWENDMTIDIALEAARWAPSVHNTQPWTFAVTGQEIAVRASTDRKLALEDPGGREMLISCGAAVFNLRTALHQAGREPIVRILPDPDRPSLLATVRLGEAVEPDEHTSMLAGQIEVRRTHRAGFTETPVPERLVAQWQREAATEGATFTPVGAPAAVRALAALTEAAQAVQSQDWPFTLEVMRWARPPGSTRGDGVPADSYPKRPADAGLEQPTGAYPEQPSDEFAQRDFAHQHPWGTDTDQSMSRATGVVALLTTREDTREAWLAAGQALQHVLLHASAHGVSAAFHTQALEEPHLRDFLRQRMCAGAYPQMLMRLGIAADESHGVRRPLTDLTDP
ncbi:Acg family FMN-binding oxidoreductase [Nonomuraea sp. NPDC049028]|uniref:Acg family FMN-binding oxidoreductase n=1 Tax=Nonomuraea sp. NPDC049028 TaxID=3364348 RepID=UPI0037175F1A